MDVTLAQVQEATGNAAETIATQSMCHWGEWVVYLMECLDDWAPAGKAEYEDELRTIQENIRVRLETGGW